MLVGPADSLDLQGVQNAPCNLVLAHLGLLVGRGACVCVCVCVCVCECVRVCVRGGVAVVAKYAAIDRVKMKPPLFCIITAVISSSSIL